MPSAFYWITVLVDGRAWGWEKYVPTHCFFRSILDQLVKLAIPATACNMSASDYAIDPVGPPVPAAPTEWPRRIAHFQMDALLSLSYFLDLPCWNISFMLSNQIRTSVLCYAAIQLRIHCLPNARHYLQDHAESGEGI